ncbi:hypothetical protein K503DRAFT_783422 [Rhizopogon vinicolor AM-OR11-026]|uniref:DUF6533 domain-containing protein n=1 Tax=Rhizopogon vinicolor AM-OR11-026 TaxID=1314800 RepID=A0A1B7MYT5_9AGAM|nr:hypothetical protein K503DRAFT_783422 [Rhizopogon vinicolor AM-OR11-026]
MTLVSNEPIWWPTISLARGLSYYQVAFMIVVVYDWVLTFGQEARYIGIMFALYHAANIPTISFTDALTALQIANVGKMPTSAVWIAGKHFQELQRTSTGWAVGDCFTVLIKTLLRKLRNSFVAMSFLHLIFDVSPKISELPPVGYEIFVCVLAIAQKVQMAVLGPRLILGLREYHAELVVNSDERTVMTSIAFQEHIHT